MFELKNEVSEDNLNASKTILKWQPFLHRIYVFTFLVSMPKVSECPPPKKKQKQKQNNNNNNNNNRLSEVKVSLFAILERDRLFQFCFS